MKIKRLEYSRFESFLDLDNSPIFWAWDSDVLAIVVMFLMVFDLFILWLNVYNFWYLLTH